MRVKARAVVWLDGRLVVASQVRKGRDELSLPGGRVHERESVEDALRREVAEETGLEVEPARLLYIAEIVGSFRTQDLELIFLAEPDRTSSLDGAELVDVLGGDRPEVRPPILEHIARDAASNWRDTPRWLGNLWRPASTAD